MSLVPFGKCGSVALYQPGPTMCCDACTLVSAKGSCLLEPMDLQHSMLRLVLLVLQSETVSAKGKCRECTSSLSRLSNTVFVTAVLQSLHFEYMIRHRHVQQVP